MAKLNSGTRIYGTAIVDTQLYVGSTTALIASAPVLDLSQTWNNTAVTFTGLKLNVTDTASASGSLLMDLQIGGTSLFEINKRGSILFKSRFGNAGTSTGAFFDYHPNAGIIAGSGNSGSGWYFGGADQGTYTAVGISGGSVIGFGTQSVTYSATQSGSIYSVNPNTDVDTIFGRRSAANLRFGAADAASPVAQTLSVQSVVAGTSNTAGANLTIQGSQGTGTGAGGSIVFQVAPAGSTGTAQNSLQSALTIDSAKDSTFTGRVITQQVMHSSSSITGWYLFGSGMYGYIGGGQAFQLFSGSFNIGGDGTYQINNDTKLTRDAGNTFAQRNGVNAQTFRLYNTFTDASNYERGVLDWATTSNVLSIGTQNAGTGTARNMQFLIGGVSKADYGVTTAGVWTLPSDLTLTGTASQAPVLTISSTLTNSPASLSFGGQFGYGVKYRLVPSSDGSGFPAFEFTLMLQNGSTGFTIRENSTFRFGFTRAGVFQVGGTSSSSPALKPSSTTLQVRLADDSDFAPLAAASIVVGNTTVNTVISSSTISLINVSLMAAYGV